MCLCYFNNIIVLTTEKADSLVRHKVDWITDIGIIVVDEVHLINDPSRGPTLEMILAKLIQMLDTQIVALSATISNADDIAKWLNAELVKSTWRPVPLSEGVYLDGTIDFENTETNQKSIRHIHRIRKEELADVVCDTLDEGGQVLVFVSSRKSTISMAKRLAPFLRKYLPDETMKNLVQIAKKIGGKSSAPEISKTLGKISNSEPVLNT